MIKKILALLLTVLMALIYPVQVMAESTGERYISEVSFGTEAGLLASGYTVIYENLVEGSEVYLGYKKTADPEKAITNLSAMNMYGGFSQLTYGQMLLENSAGITDLALQIQSAASEFTANYYAGSPYAALAYETLNALTFPADSGTEVPLGQYLVSGRCTLEDYKQIALMSSNVVISYLFNQLSFGVADNAPDGQRTWIDRLVQNGPLSCGEDMNDGEVEAIYASQYDMLYMQRAQKLYVSVQSFASSYLLAKSRSGSLDSVTVTDETSAEAEAENAANALSGGDYLAFDEEAEAANASASDSDTDLLVLGIYAKLDARDENGTPLYPFGTNADGSTRSLGEYFVLVGSMPESDDAYRLLYPLLAPQNGTAPLTQGQEILFYLNGMTSALFLAFGTQEAFAEAQSDTRAKVAELLAANNGEPVSIWYDVNTEIYSANADGVYYTSALAREAAAANRWGLLTKSTGTKGLTEQQKLNNAMIYVAIGGLAALGAALVISMVFAKTAFVITAVKGLITATLILTSYMSTMACVACIFGTVCLALAVLAVIAIIVIALIKFFKWLFDDEEEKIEMKEIPKVIYDYEKNEGGSAVIYRSVNYVGSDTPVNLNQRYSNTPWVALYYTTDKALGDPILVTDFVGSEPVSFSRTSPYAPEGYSPLSFFEDYSSANLHEGTSETLYGFLCKEKTAEVDGRGKYISEVTLKSRESEEAAKTEVLEEGFILININLTSDSDVATYLGYQTTDIAAQAITDLRVAYATGQDVSAASVQYGNAGYGQCGHVGDLILFQSKFAAAGSPILSSELMVVNTLDAVPEGYEPVNLFCGGNAFDFNNCDGWKLTTPDNGKEGSGKWQNHAYVYFHPSETYTSGNLYLGGLAFFAGNATDYMREQGWTPLTNRNIGNGLSDEGIQYNLAEGVQDGTTTLCYTTTYNPYRAISDIQFYECEPNAQGVLYNLMTEGGGAVTADIFQQGGREVGNNRMLRVTHAYRSNYQYEGGGGFEPSVYLETTCYRFYPGDGYEAWYSVNGKETACNVRCAALYVTGSAGSTPILLSELKVSSDAQYDSNTATPIRSITDYYSETGANLAFCDLYRSGNMYLYLSRKDPYAEKPKYIESVTVAYVEGREFLDLEKGCDTPYDQAVYTLVGNGAGELLDVNLTGDAGWTAFVGDYTHEYETMSMSEFAPTHYQSIRVVKHSSNYTAALVWVTYTAESSKGLSDIAIYESESGDQPTSVITSDKATTVSCGDGFRKNGKGNYYFLRAVKNNGNKITDLIVDKDIMTRNYWTSIGTDGKVSTYDVYYFKTLHAQKAKVKYYVSGFYSATGTTEAEAQKKLLDQGCRYCCPYNISPDDGHPVYVGYTLSTGISNAFSGLLLYDAGQNNTVTTIHLGKSDYTRVSDSINGGMYDSIISMYVTKSVAKACECGGTSAKTGHYITDIAFFSGTDLNDYATNTAKLNALDQKTREYVESCLFDADGNVVCWDIVMNNKNAVVNCNIGSGQPIYMYIHYSDNNTPALKSLSGSVFSEYPEYTVIAVVGGGLLLLAFAYSLVKYKKKRAAKSENTETQTQSDQ